jgi:hypothetical protein
VVSFNWDIENSKHIGKSTCGKYYVEITEGSDGFDYIIFKREQPYEWEILHSSTKPHDDIDDAKKTIMSLMALKYAIF